MFTNRTLWLFLGISGILEMLLIASNLNAYGGLGNAGSMDITLHGDLYVIVNALPVLLVIAVLFSTIFTEDSTELLFVSTVSVFVVGALFSNFTSDLQARAWGPMVAAGFGAYLLKVGLNSIGVFRKSHMPSALPEREEVQH